MLVDWALKNQNSLTNAQKIDVKKSLHKVSFKDADIPCNYEESRVKWEKKMGVQPGASLKAASVQLQAIEDAALILTADVRKALLNNTLKVSDDYIRGLIDGDGSYTISFRFREPYSKQPYRSIEFQPNCSLHMETAAEIVLDVFAYHFKLEQVSKQRRNDASGIPVSIQMYFRRLTDVTTIVEWAKQNPPVGDRRLKQLEVLAELLRLKKERKTSDINEVLKFLPKVYDIAPAGQERTYTLSEALNMAPLYCR